MSKSIISSSVFNLLVKHLVDIEEERDQIIEDYYTDPTPEKEDVKMLINNYITKIENFITQAKIEKAEKDNLPFVIIGSIVEIEDLSYHKIEKLQIISPFFNHVDMQLDYASYLSPMGQALLLKKVNDIVNLKTPVGQLKYKIYSIQLPIPYS